MEGIIKDVSGIYKAKYVCNDVKQCSINQNDRNKALNKHYFNDDTGFDNWGNVENHGLDAGGGDDVEQLCLCGQKLTVEINIVSRGDVRVLIGSSCLKKY
jgi:hypothetical protein